MLYKVKIGTVRKTFPALIFILLLSSVHGEQRPVENFKEASLLFCGDVMLDWGIREAYTNHGTQFPLNQISLFMNQFDYRFCNLECPVSATGDPHPDKKYIFLAEPESLDVLISAKINGVTLANNHTRDFGIIALLNTMTLLSQRGIDYTGAGVDVENAHVPILLKIKGTRIAIFGYTMIGYKQHYARYSYPGVAGASLVHIKRDIQKFRGFNDIIIITIHWGDEYSDFPSKKQIEHAHAIIESGADAIIGHHPHIYQGIEVYKNRPILYSLGNFLFGSINEDIRDNIVVSLKLRNRRLHSIEVYPINGNNDPLARFQPKLMTGPSADELLNHVMTLSKPLKSPFTEGALLKNSSLHYIFSAESVKHVRPGDSQ